jgi:hypothetical protein
MLIAKPHSTGISAMPTCLEQIDTFRRAYQAPWTASRRADALTDRLPG